MSHTYPYSVPADELVDRFKEELRGRYSRDERPSAREYLERFPLLCEDRETAISLIYEEFCLLEEVGERPNPSEFCRRYAPWRHSLELQLRVHRELSEAASRVASSPPPPLPRPGDYFHGFRIDSILGRGGTSSVYLAHEEAMGGRLVALKVSPDRGPEPEIVGGLDHPRIMPAFSVCRDSIRGLRGLCMPYRAGSTLDDLALRSQALRDSHGSQAFWAILAERLGMKYPTSPSPDCPGWLGFPSHGSFEHGGAWIVLAIAQAVSHIHSCGIVHCDIKPSNVYVAAREGPLLFDFGFALSTRARDATLGGTPAYMAPEQLRGFLDPRRWAEIGPAADIYALGLILLELLLGTLPDTPTVSLPGCRLAREVLTRRSRPEWPALITTGAIPPALAQIVRRCLAPCPEDRYADAEGVARSLGLFLTSSATSSTAPRSSRFGPPARRSRHSRSRTRGPRG